MAILKEAYELRSLHIDLLNYRWEAPEVNYGRTHHIVPRLYRVEDKLRNPEKSIRNLLDMDLVYRLVESIRKERVEKGGCGLVNPLIVKQANYGSGFDGKKYYVVVGNRRLLCLRGTGYDGVIPCVITKERDSWNDDTTAVRFFKQKVEGFDTCL